MPIYLRLLYVIMRQKSNEKTYRMNEMPEHCRTGSQPLLRDVRTNDVRTNADKTAKEMA